MFLKKVRCRRRNSNWCLLGISKNNGQIGSLPLLHLASTLHWLGMQHYFWHRFLLLRPYPDSTRSSWGLMRVWDVFLTGANSHSCTGTTQAKGLLLSVHSNWGSHLNLIKLHSKWNHVRTMKAVYPPSQMRWVIFFKEHKTHWGSNLCV